MDDTGRTFCRAANFGDERKFPELGVAVTICRDDKGETDGIIHVREIPPSERLRRPKGLTDRSRKR